MGLSHFIFLAILNGTGGAVYAARVPERLWPGKFDIVGASHQIMHVLVMGGATSYGLGIARATEYWHDVDRGV